jgi:hypothetical protein
MTYKIISLKQKPVYEPSKYKATAKDWNRTYASDKSSPNVDGTAVHKHFNAFSADKQFKNDATIMLFEEFGNYIATDACQSNPEVQSLEFLYNMVTLSYFPSMALSTPSLKTTIQNNVLIKPLEDAKKALAKIKKFQLDYQFKPDHFSPINTLIQYVILGVIKNIEHNAILKDCICLPDDKDGVLTPTGKFTLSAEATGMTEEDLEEVSTLHDYIIGELDQMGWNGDKSLKAKFIESDERCGKFKIFGQKDTTRPLSAATLFKEIEAAVFPPTGSKALSFRHTTLIIDKLLQFSNHPLPSFKARATRLLETVCSRLPASTTSDKKPESGQSIATKYGNAMKRYIPSIRANDIVDVSGDGNCYFWATARQMAGKMVGNTCPELLPAPFLTAVNKQLQEGSLQLTEQNAPDWIRANNALTSYRPGQKDLHTEAENYFRIALREVVVNKLTEMIDSGEPDDLVLKGQDRRVISDIMSGFLSDNITPHPQTDEFEELKANCVQFGSKGSAANGPESYATGLNLELFHRGGDKLVVLEDNPQELRRPTSGDSDAYRAHLTPELRELVTGLIDLTNEITQLPDSNADKLVHKFVKEVNRTIEKSNLIEAIETGLEKSAKTQKVKDAERASAVKIIETISEFKNSHQTIGFETGKVFFSPAVEPGSVKSNFDRYHSLRKDALTEIRSYAASDGTFMGQETSILLSTVFPGIRFVAKSHNIAIEPPYYTDQVTVQFNGHGYDDKDDLGKVPTITVIRVATQNHFNCPRI